MNKQFPVCYLCEQPINDEAQETLLKGYKGIESVHKDCLYRTTLAVWDELGHRKKKNIPLSTPYDRNHIYDPAMRKALQSDETGAVIARMIEVKDELVRKGELSSEDGALLTEDYLLETLDYA